jgi:hypothetical protein
MTSTYHVESNVELDEWTVEAIRWAYEHLGMTSSTYTDNEVLSGVVHDLLHAMADELRNHFLDDLSFRLTDSPALRMDVKELNAANALESAWMFAGAPAREEFFRRVRAPRVALSRNWIVNVHAPVGPEVTL